MSDQIWMNDWLSFEARRKRLWRKRVVWVCDMVVTGIITVAVSGVIGFTLYGFWAGL